MTPFRDLRRLGTTLLAPMMLCAALLAACGGGTSQVQSFVPARLIVFGDENSMIENDGNGDGFKFTVNDRRASTGKCLALPSFVQSLASLYGLVFEQCNPNGDLPKAFIRAQRLATVDDASTGLAQQLASQPDLNQSDLVSVMIGANDIIALYERTQTGLAPADALAEAKRRGTLVAVQVNAILRTGARAIVFTVPDLSSSPYAARANLSDPGASDLLHKLTEQFNAYLRTQIDSSTYDGRNYGLVLADDLVAPMAKNPASFLTAPAVANAAACILPDDTSGDAVATAVLACDLNRLVDGATTTSHLWASDRHIGPGAHSRIGAQATTRARGNPF